MAIFNPPKSSTSLPDPGAVVVRVTGDDRRGAVARLLNAGPKETQLVSDYLARADAEGTDFSHLWATRRTGGVGESAFTQACLAMIGAGRTAVVIVSPGLPPIADGRGAHALARRERAMLLTSACAGLADSAEPVVLAQALLEPDDVDMIGAYQDAGFSVLARLGYLRRAIPREGRGTPPGPIGPGLRVVALADIPPAKRDALLREVLAKTYEQTLDCPDLCGLRTVDDVIDSHVAVGEFDPRLWLLVMADGQAEGCLLLSGGASEDTVELVYLGLSPALRGRGISDAMLREGLWRLRGRPETTLACAVDLANAPALDLYRRGGFSRFTERVALVRPIGGGTENR